MRRVRRLADRERVALLGRLCWVSPTDRLTSQHCLQLPDRSAGQEGADSCAHDGEKQTTYAVTTAPAVPSGVKQQQPGHGKSRQQRPLLTTAACVWDRRAGRWLANPQRSFSAPSWGHFVNSAGGFCPQHWCPPTPRPGHRIVGAWGTGPPSPRRPPASCWQRAAGVICPPAAASRISAFGDEPSSPASRDAISLVLTQE